MWLRTYMVVVIYFVHGLPIFISGLLENMRKIHRQGLRNVRDAPERS